MSVDARADRVCVAVLSLAILVLWFAWRLAVLAWSVVTLASAGCCVLWVLSGCVVLWFIDFECFDGVLGLGFGGVELMLCECLVWWFGLVCWLCFIVVIVYFGLQSFYVVRLCWF